MKKCSVCGKSKALDLFLKEAKGNPTRDGLRPGCKECSRLAERRRMKDPVRRKRLNKYRSEWRKRNRDTINNYRKTDKWKEQEKIRMGRPHNKIKTRTRGTLNGKVRYGKVIRQPCEICGNLKVEAHHPDYSQPLKVQWLCIPHHQEIHRKVAV